MSKERQEKMAQVAALLQMLRKEISTLARLETAQVTELSGHQTVDDRQSLTQCFLNLEASLNDIEDTLATLVEATERGIKL